MERQHERPGPVEDDRVRDGQGGRSLSAHGPPGSGESADVADESEPQRLTRNLNELLQELRVTQTGVQILTGFLLTLPFTDRFQELDAVQLGAYLSVLCGSVLATGLIIAPVAFHRVLFRHGERPWLVEAANRAARAGLLALALTTSGVVWLVFDLVVDRPWASVAGALSLVFFGVLWMVVPMRAPTSSSPIG